ncbi:MAG: KH domain-containing protein [Actinobacteria bacterium]|nr:KH domain-containing protein [Actinomycetota bacterium]MCL5446359.1 KH domain-containing protein [Actinomycetota bacterium]
MSEEAENLSGETDGAGRPGEPVAGHGGLGKSQEVLAYLARSIAREPDAVRVSGSVEGNKAYLKISAAKSDMGRLIGRGGRVANAIRILVKAAGSLDDLDTDVEFVDS